jgi:hypothetical protein
MPGVVPGVSPNSRNKRLTWVVSSSSACRDSHMQALSKYQREDMKDMTNGRVSGQQSLRQTSKEGNTEQRGD